MTSYYEYQHRKQFTHLDEEPESADLDDLTQQIRDSIEELRRISQVGE